MVLCLWLRLFILFFRVVVNVVSAMTMLIFNKYLLTRCTIVAVVQVVCARYKIPMVDSLDDLVRFLFSQFFFDSSSPRHLLVSLS